VIFTNSNATYFATDLTNFLACRHLTALDRLAANGGTKRPFFDDPMLEVWGLRRSDVDLFVSLKAPGVKRRFQF
jgi:hypothetical protein